MPNAPAPMPEPSPTPTPPQGEMPNDPMMGGDAMGNEMPEDPMVDSEKMPSEPDMETPMGDENEGGDDKKKEIQKLAGELSELLHTYNEENGEDEELNKYVKGMIDAQTDGDVDDSDNENPDIEDEGDMENPEEMGEDPMGEDPMGDEENLKEPQESEQPKMEGRRLTKKELKEEFAQNCKKEKDNIDRMNKKLNNSGVSKQNPFTPPKFN